MKSWPYIKIFSKYHCVHLALYCRVPNLIMELQVAVLMCTGVKTNVRVKLQSAHFSSVWDKSIAMHHLNHLLLA